MLHINDVGITTRKFKKNAIQLCLFVVCIFIFVNNLTSELILQNIGFLTKYSLNPKFGVWTFFVVTAQFISLVALLITIMLCHKTNNKIYHMHIAKINFILFTTIVSFLQILRINGSIDPI